MNIIQKCYDELLNTMNSGCLPGLQCSQHRYQDKAVTEDKQ